jgi:HEPN domain-containing protein
MSDEGNPLAWIVRAEEDYLLARLALRRKKPLTYGACFHAQQCGEKYIKAILVSKSTIFPKTHDLLLLNDLCVKAGVMLPVDNKQLDTLSNYAVRVRYPGDKPEIEESQEAVMIAGVRRHFVRKFLGVK